MKRREFITLVGGAAAAWPLVARGQHSGMPVIGLLSSGAPDSYAYLVAAFHLGLQEQGLNEGQNVTVEYRWAAGDYDRLPALASELTRYPVDVIVTLDGTAAALAAKNAGRTTPVVFVIGADPVKFGLVASLNRPGANVTGVNVLTVGPGAKRLELLQELVPQVGLIGMLVNPNNPNAITETSDVETAGRQLGKRIVVVKAGTVNEFDGAFEALVTQKVGGLLVQTEPLFTSNRALIVALADRHRIPAIHAYREFTAIGGLMSYGTNQADARRLAGSYSARILKGEKPSDLPVQQATKVELAINLRTARALGLEIPPTLLARADEVIE